MYLNEEAGGKYRNYDEIVVTVFGIDVIYPYDFTMITLEVLGKRINSLMETEEEKRMTICLGKSVSDDPLDNLISVMDACPEKIYLEDIGANLEKDVTLKDYIDKDVNYKTILENYSTTPEVEPFLRQLIRSLARAGQKTFLK